MADDNDDNRRKKRKKPALKREFDPSRWAHLIFALGGFTGAWVLAHAVEDIWAILWQYFPTIGRASSSTSNVIGITIALVATVITWRNPRYFKFATEVVVEISQVTWPTKSEIRAATVVVIVITIITSALLFGMDQIWSLVTDSLYGI